MLDLAQSSPQAALRTSFAPAERATPQCVRRQYELLAALPFVRAFLDATPAMAVILNEERQIVFANRAFAAFVGSNAPDTVVYDGKGKAIDSLIERTLGLRPGESVRCIHSRETDGGCGTTPFCRECGAVQAIMNSQTKVTRDIQECRIICGNDATSDLALDLRVWAEPVLIADERFTIFSMQDISDEKRRKTLERIFFHDVLNTAGGVKGLADLLVQTKLPEETLQEVAAMVADSSNHLIEEIGAQRALTAAEHGELEVVVRDVQSIALLERVIGQFHSHAVSRDRDIHVHDATEDFVFTTDPVLMRRVLVNLVKNAFEAVPAGGVVTISARLEGDDVVFSVHNPTVMPQSVQMQVFQRSFTTKGSGRGLGTYSVKLLTERYLHGRAWFISAEDAGTTFFVRCPSVIGSESAH